jgi:hypothetical protein
MTNINALCGYLRADAQTTDHDLAQAVSDLAALAAAEGLELGTVIVEWTDDAGAAFKAAANEIAALDLAGPRPSQNPHGPLLLACAHAGRAETGRE